mgnify:CR=1 FL=1
MSELQKRGKVLEEKFFKEQDAKVIAALREKLQREEAQKSLSEHTGISDPARLEGIIAQGISVASLIVVRMIPLVLMSWASGRVEEKEEEIIMNHLHKNGIASDSPVRALVLGWLRIRPNDLEESWLSFMSAYLPTLSAEDKEVFKQEVLEISTDIARAGGGFLSFATVSEGEKELLERLNKALL